MDDAQKSDHNTYHQTHHYHNHHHHHHHHYHHHHHNHHEALLPIIIRISIDMKVIEGWDCNHHSATLKNENRRIKIVKYECIYQINCRTFFSTR
jgi:hypothetical protein